jgi:phage minor structural protein
MAVPMLHLFDRWDERVGILPTLGSMTHTEEVDGEDTIEFDCLLTPEKGDRVVWRDPTDGRWREHEVVRTDEPLEGPCHVYAESSVCELLRDYVVEEQLVSRTAAQAMAAVLGVTRWSVGDVTVGDAKRGALLYHTNALAALRRVASVWGGELLCEVGVEGGRVATRSVSLLSRVGGWHGARFTYGRNLAGCTRTVLEDEVFTALYGWGKGLPIEDGEGNPTGGYTRRLSFESVNGSVKWVGDDEARERWGRWDAARGERVHAFGQVVFPECEDPSELLALTRAALADVCRPRVSYECDVAMLDGGEDVGLGDDVAVVDTSRTPEWRLTARCVRRVRTFGDGATRTHVTLGSVERATWEASAEMLTRVVAVEETASAASDTVASFEDLSTKEF